MPEDNIQQEYDHTPSYFKNCEYFNNYLGQTSYYTGLQKALNILVKQCKPSKVIDFGCALGVTTFLLADNFPDIEFSGLDMREDVVSKTNKMQERRDLRGRDNASFICHDMMEFARSEELQEYDFIYMLYSFHHIPDPEMRKVQFIEDVFNNMRSGSHLFIGETFLPEDDTSILKLWDVRSMEGYASTFWNCLERGSKLAEAHNAAVISKREEVEAGRLVGERNDEYLVTRAWLTDELKHAGFSIVLNEPVNAVGDGVVLVKKV